VIAVATTGTDAGENGDAPNVEPEGAPAPFVVPRAADTVATNPLEAATRQIAITTTTIRFGNRSRDIGQCGPQG
jgi:hypothetical protein